MANLLGKSYRLTPTVLKALELSYPVFNVQKTEAQMIQLSQIFKVSYESLILWDNERRGKEHAEEGVGATPRPTRQETLHVVQQATLETSASTTNSDEEKEKSPVVRNLQKEYDANTEPSTGTIGNAKKESKQHWCQIALSNNENPQRYGQKLDACDEKLDCTEEACPSIPDGCCAPCFLDGLKDKIAFTSCEADHFVEAFVVPTAVRVEDLNYNMILANDTNDADWTLVCNESGTVWRNLQ